METTQQKTQATDSKTIEKNAQLEQLQYELAIAQQKELKQRMQSSEETFSVITEIKNSLKNTLKESKSSQSIVKWMYGITFGLGVLLILVSIYFAFKGEDFLAITFAGIGLLDIIAHLVAKPPLQLQDARSNYTQLTVAVLTWFNDLIDKSALMATYQNFANAIVSQDPLTHDKLALREENLQKAIAISEKQFDNTIRMLNVIEALAEPSSRKVIVTKNTEKGTVEVKAKD